MAKSERPTWLKPKTMIVGGALCVALVIVIYLNVGGGSGAAPLDPTEETRNQLARLQSESIAFVAREQRIPASLDEVDATGKKTDGWESPFQFTPGTEGPKKASFLIRSVGQDKQPETPDDWTVKVIFADDGYGKLGSEQVTKVEPQ